MAAATTRRSTPLRAQRSTPTALVDAPRADDPRADTPGVEPWMIEIMRQAAERKARRSWFARHKKLTVALAILVALVLGAGIAWALLQKDIPVSGSISGEDGRVDATFFSSPSGTLGPCAWSTTSTALSITGAKLPSGTTNKCRTTLTVRNDGNVDMKVQAFAVTSTAGTVASGFPSGFGGGCGTTLAPGQNVQIGAGLDASMPAGSSGTLTGKLTLVDAASWSAGACSAALQ